MAKPVLLIDADDTLWENNIYFERVIAHFMSALNHSRLPAAEIRGRLNVIEREAILAQGYGTASFASALLTAFQEMAEEPPSDAQLEEIFSLAMAIMHEPIDLLPGVVDTLERLSSRCRLVMFTKGDYAEQSSKIRRSGLRQYFVAEKVLPEKTAQVYREAQREFAAGEFLWMVGNSPKSDINPAFEAGLGTVFIPHPHTWILEHEPLLEGVREAPTFLQLERFADLLNHF